MKTITNNRLFAFCASALYVLSAGHPVMADDTEVLIGSNGQVWSKPNVLFIMDTSGSMGEDINGIDPPAAGLSSKLDIVKGVFSNLMTNNSGFNVALMRFDSHTQGANHGGYFISPMQELTSSSSAGIIATANAMNDGGSTPLAETLYEAALFYRGMAVDFGDNTSPGTNVNGVLDTSNTANYKSPIIAECQANYVILLTDGEPTHDGDADNSPRIPNLPGYNSGSCAFSSTNSDTSGSSCLDEVADYLHTVDQSTGASGFAGTQTVETYTIGFTTNQQLLEATGLAGGGTPTAGGGNDHYFTTSNGTGLATALKSIFKGISDASNTFTPPAIAANAFSGVSHFDRMYFALYEPAGAPKWKGNVKPYALNDSFGIDDAGGNDAIDHTSGLFLATSRSFWSLSADGSSIDAGGANGQLPGAASRSLYTYTGDYSASSNFDLSHSDNALKDSTSGSNLTPAMLGVSTVADSDNIINTMRAAPLGAPLHSQPTLVTYGGTEAVPDQTLFVGTNDGFLHALNARTGVERFAFVPKELLPNLDTLVNGVGTNIYGLDGGITVWVEESNDADHTIDISAGSTDHVYVYVGMRRGGNNYYALDVTNRANPKLKWVIKGGTGAGHTPGFEELGQTWSKPTLADIKYGGSTKKVLIFGGGYDTAQDANPLNADPLVPDDTIGRAIFIVDADDGSLLWYASPTASPTAPASAVHYPMTDFKNSIPSDVRLLDSDLDGNTDRLYVGDMRGQVFRFDLQDSPTGITGTGFVLARLGGATEADNRRFYYPPDVVVTQKGNASPYISVNIGSGYRAHPLNPTNPNGTPAARVNDRFYSLRDPNVINIPASFTPITNASTDLLDVTSIPVLTSNNTTTLDGLDGWYITLGNSGEKVLSPSMTVSGEIFFTTYTPPAAVAPGRCAPEPGDGRLYRISLFDGSPVIDQNGDSDTNDVEDRYDDINDNGLSGTTTVFHKDSVTGKIELGHCEGTECDPLPNAIQIQPTYWKEGT